MLISFDFDSTCTLPEWDERLEAWWSSEFRPNPSTIEAITFAHSLGHSCIIVTSRLHDQRDDVLNFIERHSLPIETVICTNGEDKANTLVKLAVDLHVDDDVQECMVAKMNQVNVLIMVHPWDRFHNSSVSFFEEFTLDKFRDMVIESDTG